VAAEWGSEEGMVSEINGNRIEKSVLFGEGYGGGARSHGLRLGVRDGETESRLNEFEIDEIRVLLLRISTRESKLSPHHHKQPFHFVSFPLILRLSVTKPQNMRKKISLVTLFFLPPHYYGSTYDMNLILN
jgi:hypothetical protein